MRIPLLLLLVNPIFYITPAEVPGPVISHTLTSSDVDRGIAECLKGEVKVLLFPNEQTYIVCPGLLLEDLRREKGYAKGYSNGAVKVYNISPKEIPSEEFHHFFLFYSAPGHATVRTNCECEKVENNERDIRSCYILSICREGMCENSCFLSVYGDVFMMDSVQRYGIYPLVPITLPTPSWNINVYTYNRQMGVEERAEVEEHIYINPIIYLGVLLIVLGILLILAPWLKHLQKLSN